MVDLCDRGGLCRWPGKQRRHSGVLVRSSLRRSLWSICVIFVIFVAVRESEEGTVREIRRARAFVVVIDLCGGSV